MRSSGSFDIPTSLASNKPATSSKLVKPMLASQRRLMTCRRAEPLATFLRRWPHQSLRVLCVNCSIPRAVQMRLLFVGNVLSMRALSWGHWLLRQATQAETHRQNDRFLLQLHLTISMSVIMTVMSSGPICCCACGISSLLLELESMHLTALAMLIARLLTCTASLTLEACALDGLNSTNSCWSAFRFSKMWLPQCWHVKSSNSGLHICALKHKIILILGT